MKNLAIEQFEKDGLVKGAKIRHTGGDFDDVQILDHIRWNEGLDEWEVVTQEGKVGSIHYIEIVND